ncbi:MAG: hypothetical protein OXB88_01375 [Bacteriovoracales bacterium]|nr:hypothetical protein [Bacteriovoracales bacterium]
MSGETVKTRKSYSQEFKTQAIELAKELGSKEASNINRLGHCFLC